VKGKSMYRRKLRSQTSYIWTDARTVVRRVREKKESEKRASGKKIKVSERAKKESRNAVFSNVFWLRRVR
jgi:hypothetical protein